MRTLARAGARSRSILAGLLRALESRRFEILRRLGAGGCGVVFEARDRERGGLVALKTLSQLEPRALYRFKREFRALADVSHPAVLPLYELLCEDETWFFTMELVDGVDFASWVRGEDVRDENLASTVRAVRPEPDLPIDLGEAATEPKPQPPLDVERLRDATRQLASGIAVLHAHGLVHRDLKPSNVLVDRAGRVRILDFGLIAERSDPSEEIAGTPIYMSPEQAAGKPADAASDWYSLGVMLYEALAGEPPHRGTIYQLIVLKNTVDPPSPSVVYPEIDPSLERLCMALLARDPSARPSGAEVMRALGTPPSESLGSLPPGARADVFVGRKSHRDALEAALDAARDGAVVVRVHGPSGAGKSHLIARFTESLRGGGGPRVLSARCFEQETVPYVSLDGIVDAIVRELHALGPGARAAAIPNGAAALATVFPVMRSVIEGLALSDAMEPHETRRAAARALREIVANLAGDSPIVIHLDDAHWGDADSAPFLLSLLRLPRILLLLSHRSGTDDTALLSALAKEGVLSGARTVEVGPLDPDEVRELVRHVWPTAGDGRVEALAARIREESGGNAMFAHELAARAPLVPSASEPEQRSAGLSMEALIAERVVALDDASRALLEVVALAAAPVAREVAETAAGVEGRSVAAVRALTGARLVRVGGDRNTRVLAPYHDRVRAVTTGGMDPVRVRSHHLALADAHEHVGDASPELLSHHLHAAGEHARALPHTLAAARRASAALAFDRAAALFARAVEHVPSDDPERPARLVELADALVDAGRGAEAAARYLEALPDVEPTLALELRRRAADQLIRSGRIDRGIEQMNALLDDLGLARREGRASALASVVAGRARLALRGREAELRSASEVDPRVLAKVDACFSFGTGLTLVDPLRGLELTVRAIRMALDAGEPSRVARAYAHEATFAVRTGEKRFAEAEAFMVRARELAKEVDDPFVHAALPLADAMVQFFAGRFRESIVACEDAEARLRRCPGASWERETAQRTLLKAMYHTGDLARLVETVTPALEVARDRRDLYAEVSLRTRIWYLTCLVGDTPDEAIPPLDDAIARWSGKLMFLQHFFELVARVEVDLYRGRGDMARERVESMWRAIDRSQLLRGQYVGTEARHVRARALLAGGDARGARATAKRMAKEGAPWCVGLAGLVLGGVDFAASPERAIAAFHRSERTLEAAGLRLFAASARHRRGELIGGDEGRALRDGAAAAFSVEGVKYPVRMVDVFAPVVR